MKPVVSTIVIDSTVDEVAAQFADVAHHERTGVHAASSFEVLAEHGDIVDYRQRSRLGARTIVQTMQLDRADARRQVNTVVAGAFAGSTIDFEIRPTDSRSTTVTATLTLTPSLTTRLLGPLLSIGIRRTLDDAFAEDKHDIESGTFAAAHTDRGSPTDRDR